MKRAFITHVTENYLEIARNLALSVRAFSEIPLIVYIINPTQNHESFFNDVENILIREIDLELDEISHADYTFNHSGNFYVNRKSPKVYKILCGKILALESALEEGFDEICYLDSDCVATPIIDEIFEWSSSIKDYPHCSEGIHQYMIVVENGKEIGNPFEGCWPESDLTKTLEWPLMQFLQINEAARGTYRTTNVILANTRCLNFIKVWKELCYLLPKLNVDLSHYAAYHEETVYNVLSWKKTNEGLPLCYINLRDGMQTVKHFYEEGMPGFSTWMDEENKDYSMNFYLIPHDKRNVKVLHGEKRREEFEKILQYLVELNQAGYFKKSEEK
jgi:hypothetical protein